MKSRLYKKSNAGFTLLETLVALAVVAIAMAAFPENIHWEGVDYEGANLKIQREGYADRDPIYFRDGRDLATPKKGRVMADVAISWVAEKMKAMLDN